MAAVAAAPKAPGGAGLSGAALPARALLLCTCIYLDRSGGTEGASNVQRDIHVLQPRSPEFLFLVDFACLAPNVGLWGDAIQVEVFEGPQTSLPSDSHIEGRNGDRGGRARGAGGSGTVRCDTPGMARSAVYLHTWTLLAGRSTVSEAYAYLSRDLLRFFVLGHFAYLALDVGPYGRRNRERKI